MTRPLPNLQFAVLSALGADALSGRDLRSRLSALDVKKSGPAFYRLMARLEERELVRGWYEQEVSSGQIVRERHYQITATGSELRAETADFHTRLMSAYAEGAEAGA